MPTNCNPYTHKNAFNTNLLSPDNDRVDMYRCEQTFKMCSMINSKQKLKHWLEKINIYITLHLSHCIDQGHVELSSKKLTKKSSMNHNQQLKKTKILLPTEHGCFISQRLVNIKYEISIVHVLIDTYMHLKCCCCFEI